MKHWKNFLSALLIAALLCAPAALAEADEADESLARALTQAFGDTAKVYTHNGRVTFVDGAFTADPVADMADAAELVSGMLSLLGGDDRTWFEPWRTLTDAAGNHYYVFQQMYANTTVSGGAVKIVTDPDGAVLGLVSSVETELPEVQETGAIDAAQAEALVLRHAEEGGQAGLELIEGRTERVILPVNPEIDVESEEEKEESRFVWAVFTNNPDGSLRSGSDLPYLAHYVTMDGEYLYSLPTIVPGDEAGASGFEASYLFEFMEPVDYTGTVTLSDGTEQEISIQLMRDSRTGMYYLGNLERRIAVADGYEFLYNSGHVVLEASQDNADWDDTCLLSLYNYCRAWDYYNAIGWQGGDGLGTPILILKDYCDSKHTPIDNAAYAGKYYGWQLFLSSSINDFAQCLDILAHEFTHCVTGSVMTYNAYKNDYGAINEAISDIQGNICEMLMGATDDEAWLLGDMGSTTVRSMSDPHRYSQPEYAWDIYYKSKVKTPTDINDRGGVHSNSSLLNNVAYRLCNRGGMTLEEARAFWFAVDCAMVPGTDYAQLAELLPWVLRNQGLEQYLPALEAAMDATRLSTDAIPDTFDADRALVTLSLPDTEQFGDGNWQLMILSVDTDGVVQRVNDILSGEGEYAGAMKELIGIVRSALSKADGAAEAEEDESLLDVFASALEQALMEQDESQQDAQAETEPPIDKSAILALRADLSDWFYTYFSDVIYFSSGAAGQDGLTVRMVCRPGITLPILLRLEMKGLSPVPKSAGLAVYTMDRWIDLGSMIQAVMTQDEATGGANTKAMLIALLPLISEGMEHISDAAWWQQRLFFEIRGGDICEIPQDGLEQVNILDGDSMEALWGMMNETEGAEADGAEDDGAEADGAEDDGAEDDGAEADGAEADGAEDDGAEDDGAEDDGAEADGAETDGAEDDGAEDDGAEDDGAEDDGAEADGAEADGAEADSAA